MRYEFGPFLNQFWVDDVSKLSQNLKNNSPQSTFDFCFSSSYHHWYMKFKFEPFWPNFGLILSLRQLIMQCFEKLISGKNSLLQSSIKYWFRSFYLPQYMIYDFGSFWLNLEIMKWQKKWIFQNFEKLTKEFDLNSWKYKWLEM